MMEQDVALTALKAVSIVVTGILGIVGVLGKFKRKDGRPTWSGVVTVIGITFTMLISVIVTLQEAEKEKEEAHKQLDRMEGLYQEIHRTIQPITYVNLAFSAALPMGDKNVKHYAAYLDTIISSRKSKLQHSFTPVKGLSVRVQDHNGDIIAIEIDQNSPYWPKKDNLLNRLAHTLSFEIYLRKDPIKPELLNPAIVGDYGNDLIVWATEPLAWPNNVIWLDYPSKKLSIHSSGDYLKKLWHTTGRIASVQDLFGAQLFLRLPVPPEIYDLMNSLDIKTMTLELAPGRTFSIRGEKFNKVRLSDGSLVLSIVLPKTEKELFFGLGRD